MTLAFADCEFDPDGRELRRDGNTVSIEPRTLDLLSYLIENRSRAIGKDELQDKVWGTIVSDAAMTRAVMKLRKALGDSKDNAAIIKTVSRFGYRFVARISGDSSTDDADNKSGRQGIAVLPLANMSGDPENEYFSDGIAEEILNLLAKFPELRVSSRTSSFAFRNSSQTLKQIADSLDVEIVLEGSVRKSGNRVRITMQLIDAKDDSHLWSEIYDRELTDIFAVQAEIAGEVVSAMTRGEAGSITIYKATDKPEAYEYFLRGRHLCHTWDRGSQTRAIAMFERAIELDPGYARAWAGLANSGSLMYMWWEASDTNLNLADEASRKALQLAPNLSEAHTARAFALTVLRDFDSAVEEFEQALELDPQSWEAWYLYGRAMFARGEHLRAVELFRKAAEVQPDEYQAAALATTSYTALKDAVNTKIWAAESVRRAEAHLALHPDDTRALTLGACNLAEVGLVDQGIEWVEKALRIAPDDIGVLHNAGCMYGLLGEVDKALDLFERRFAAADVYMDWVDNDSDFDSIRDHPRFIAMVEAKAKR